jgi:hypothetical protein
MTYKTGGLPYEKGEMKTYPERNCPYCGEPIPKLTKSNNPIRASRYTDLQSCHDRRCMQAVLRKSNGQAPPKQFVKTNSPIDKFIYAGPSHE